MDQKTATENFNVLKIYLLVILIQQISRVHIFL